MGKSDIQAQVRKVCEITKCSQEDAAYVLGEHDNDVDRAVMAIVDQPDVNVWKENKKKSSKKEEKKQTVTTRRPGPRLPRPVSKANPKAGGKSGGETDVMTTGGGVKQSTDTEFSLKNGPLVFESSAISKPAAATAVNNDFPPVGGTFNSSVYGSAATTTVAGGAADPKKLSFAAVAAKNKAPLPPPPVVQQQKPTSQHPLTTTFAGSNASNVAPKSTTEDGGSSTSQQQIDSPDSITEKFEEAKLDDHPTTTAVADSQPIDDSQQQPIGASSSTFSSNVNREFTDQLKNDIGIGLASSHRSVGGLSTSETIPPPPVSLGYGSVFSTSQTSAQAPILDLISDSHLTPAHASSSNVGVEFLDDLSSPRATGFEFCFNKFAASNNSVIGRPQQPSAAAVQQQTSSPKSDPVAVSRNNASLSYTYPNSFDYQSSDVRQPTGGAGGITDVLFGSGKVNGATGHHLTQETLPSQQVAPSHQQPSAVGQQHQSAASVHQQQQVAQQQQPAAAQPSTQQHSLQQQQQQMYTAAQFPGYTLPYLYSPVMRDKNGMVFDSSVVGGGQTHQQPSHNKPSAGNDYGAGALVTTAGNAFNASIYDNSSSSAGDPKKLSFAAVAPPPGFSTPHFVPQQGLQSLFHGPSQSMFSLPGGYPAHMPFSLLFPGGGPQQQQSQQRQPPLQQGHYGQQQHLLQNHHQPQQQRHAAAALGGMDHVSFMDMAKYPNGGSNNNLQGLGNPTYHNAAFGMGGNSGANQGQQLHRNQSLNQDNEGAGPTW